jgi:hypothetical protein
MPALRLPAALLLFPEFDGFSVGLCSAASIAAPEAGAAAGAPLTGGGMGLRPSIAALVAAMAARCAFEPCDSATSAPDLSCYHHHNHNHHHSHYYN